MSALFSDQDPESATVSGAAWDLERQDQVSGTEGKSVPTTHEFAKYQATNWRFVLVAWGFEALRGKCTSKQRIQTTKLGGS